MGLAIATARGGADGIARAAVVPWTVMTFDELVHRPKWMLDALCREYPGWSWFPTAGQSSKNQTEVCSRCSVRTECLTDALDRDERHGLWGGVDTKNRMRLLGTAA